MPTLIEQLMGPGRAELDQKIDEAVRRATEQAIQEHWLHGSPISVFENDQVVKVWPSDAEIERFPCYQMVIEQYQRKLARK